MDAAKPEGSVRVGTPVFGHVGVVQPLGVAIEPTLAGRQNNSPDSMQANQETLAVNKFTTGETESELDISTLRYKYPQRPGERYYSVYPNIPSCSRHTDDQFHRLQYDP